MNEYAAGTVKVNGENADSSLEGSHHLMVEIMKTLASLDADDMVIKSFKMEIDVIDGPHTDVTEVTYLGKQNGVEVSIDTNQLKRLKMYINKDKEYLFQFLDHHADDTGTIHKENFDAFVDDLVNQLCKSYTKQLISAILHLPVEKDLDHEVVDYTDLNALFKALSLPYHIRKLWDDYQMSRD